jgi:hypothetical protein
MRSGELATTSELPDQVAALSAALTADRVLAADRRDGLPPGWSGMIAAARRSDGPPLQRDFADARLVVDDTAVQVDTLISQPGSWWVYLRASPAWLRRGHDPLSFRPVMIATRSAQMARKRPRSSLSSGPGSIRLPGR